jgi:cell division protein ZapE
MQQFSHPGRSLVEISPSVSADTLLADLVPPPEFEGARFATYVPDKEFPSQSQAVAACKDFLGNKRKLFTRKELVPGVYLDGGFGVGKTHLLASIYHQHSGRKLFGAFLDMTAITGYLGFAEMAKRLSSYDLICIDEFELDDPGDTMIMSRLLKELSNAGVRFAATSNTPPNALGEGRFAAADFKREIQGLGERFKIVSVDGRDFRHRDIESHSAVLSEEGLIEMATENTTVDDFKGFLQHLSTLHPTKFRYLLKDVEGIILTNVSKLVSQVDALRLVSFIDRAYEQQVPIRASGEVPLTDVFTDEMIAGGYKKKYLRCVSRASALSTRPFPGTSE